MAVKELDVMTQEALKERYQRHPLLDIVNNREEIRIMSEKTVEYVGELYDDLKKLPIDVWQIMPIVTVEFIKGAYKFLNTHKKKNVTSKIDIGKFISFSIEYGETVDADKEGTFNPLIELGDELKYDNSDASKNDLIMTAPDIPEDANIEFICSAARNILQDKYSIVVEDWRAVLHIAIAFIRQARKFLIEHRDDEEYGYEINLCEVVDITIEKYDTDSGVEYCFQILPGQQLKLDSKDDGTTEEVSTPAQS